MKVDAAIITALPKEWDAVFRRMKDSKVMYGTSSGSIRRYHVFKNPKGLAIAAVQAKGMGQLQAAIIAGDVLLDCAPKIILLVGIAAGIGRGIAVGDVLISNQIIDYELAKLTDDGEIMDYQVFGTSPRLLEYLREAPDHGWAEDINFARPDKQNAIPAVHQGDIFCGNKVVADTQTIPRLLGQFRKAIGLEMESAGVASLLAQRSNAPDFMMIKSVCDKGDPAKSDEWQEYAANTAAAFAFSLLNSNRLVADFKSQGPVAKTQLEIENETRHVIDFVIPDVGSLEAFQRRLVKQIVHSSLEEVDAVAAGRYSTEIGHGQQFLLRAGALFGAASRVHATSLDTVSTFWTTPYNRDDARKYLACQAPNGVAARLFVFTNADNTHNYARVLDQHDNAYKNVFVCSMQHYNSILADISSGQSPEKLRNRDFALLSYPTGGPSDYTVFAELDNRSLKYREIDLGHPGDINFRWFLDCFDRFMKVERGRLDNQGRVLRWQDGLWKQKDEWASILNSMFAERQSDFVHMVFFKFASEDKKKHREMLAHIKRSITTSSSGSPIAQRYHIKDVWLGRSSRLEVRDFVHRGHIRTTENVEFPYVLIMKFEDQEGLRQYYEDKDHAELREELYRSFDDRRFGVIYGAVRDASSEEAARPFGDAIESMAERFISRRDYSNIEMIREMVSTTTPYAP